jgi:predicted dehydrogenase/nucleoside-diphosphate-sugar epimerase
MTELTPFQADHDSHRLLRIGIVGCGRVAAHHLRFISQIPGVTIAGLADQNERAAHELGERYKVNEVHGSLEAMLGRADVDILHVLTPPFHHYAQTLTAIQHGAHVLIEKPVTFQADETEELYRQAAAQGVLLCPDFIQLFHPVFLKARAIVDSGQLGRVIHVEACISEGLDSPEVREARGLHWSFQLPGGVMHNLITHPLYLALYFLGTPEALTVKPRSLGVLPQGLTDHIEALIETARGSAYVVVSHAMRSRPSYYVNVFCENGVVSVNFDTSTLLVNKPGTMPRSLERASANFMQATKLCASGIKNISDFVRGRLVPYQGLQELLPQFYAAVRNRTEPPISPQLAKAVVRAEEEIFSRAGKLHLDLHRRRGRRTRGRRTEQVLVTGAAGYLGSEVVRLLVKEGYAVRAIVRPLSNIQELEDLGVEIFFGDVRDPEFLLQAAEGMDIVVHAAAGLRGSTQHIVDSCVIGTQNVADVARKAKLRRVIYISSMSVYDFWNMKKGEVITENSPLDDHPEFRGAYSLAKRKAEDIALNELRAGNPSWTILRPSVIVGRKKDPLGPIDSFRIGNTIVCMSPPKKTLRLIHVEDVAETIVRVLRDAATQGKIFVASSPENLRLEEYIRVCVRGRSPGEKLRVVHIPSWFATLGVASLMLLRKVTGKGPSMNLRRLAPVYRELGVSSDVLKTALNWEPPQGLLERLSSEKSAGQLPATTSDSTNNQDVPVESEKA